VDGEYCHAYVDIFKDRGLSVSMTEVNHCYENAMAERVNGILKKNLESKSPNRKIINIQIIRKSDKFKSGLDISCVF